MLESKKKNEEVINKKLIFKKSLFEFQRLANPSLRRKKKNNQN